jgi:acetyl-CoA synthetase
MRPNGDGGWPRCATTHRTLHSSESASQAEITHALDSLRIAPILRGARGQGALDVDAAVAAIHRLALQFHADSWVAEVDLNPLLVRPQGRGAVALDVLVVPLAPSTRA